MPCFGLIEKEKMSLLLLNEADISDMEMKINSLDEEDSEKAITSYIEYF